MAASEALEQSASRAAPEVTVATAPRSWIRRHWKLLLGTAVFVGYGLSGGCFAQRLPPLPDAQEEHLLETPALPYSVLVVPWVAGTHRGQAPAPYAEATYGWLNSSKAFASVRLGTTSDTSGVDFVAYSAGLYCNANPVPMFTIISLGLIPTIFTDTDCEGAVLWPTHPLAGRRDSVLLTSSISTPSVMGWLAVPLGLLPNWTHSEARGQSRTAAQVRLAILRHRAQLAALAPQGGT